MAKVVFAVRKESAAGRPPGSWNPSTDVAADVANALAGNEHGRDAVARRAATLALRTAMGVLGDRHDASDVAQEVAIDALRHLRRLRDPDAFDSWIHRITVRRTMRLLRRRRVRIARESGGDDELMQAVDSAAGVATHEHLVLRDSVRGALAALPARQQVAVVLRYVHDLSERQIADALGCAPGTAASLLSRAREQLRSNPQLASFADHEETAS